MKQRHQPSWAQRIGTKRPYWRERAQRAEALLEEDEARHAEEVLRLSQVINDQRALITKRNQAIRAQKKEITALKGRITVLKEYGYDPGPQ
jgi:16S rRNA U1498 N3-methylase RsmE